MIGFTDNKDAQALSEMLTKSAEWLETVNDGIKIAASKNQASEEEKNAAAGKAALAAAEVLEYCCEKRVCLDFRGSAGNRPGGKRHTFEMLAHSIEHSESEKSGAPETIPQEVLDAFPPRLAAEEGQKSPDAQALFDCWEQMQAAEPMYQVIGFLMKLAIGMRKILNGGKLSNARDWPVLNDWQETDEELQKAMENCRKPCLKALEDRQGAIFQKSIDYGALRQSGKYLDIFDHQYTLVSSMAQAHTHPFSTDKESITVPSMLLGRRFQGKSNACPESIVLALWLIEQEQNVWTPIPGGLKTMGLYGDHRIAAQSFLETAQKDQNRQRSGQLIQFLQVNGIVYGRLTPYALDVFSGKETPFPATFLLSCFLLHLDHLQRKPIIDEINRKYKEKEAGCKSEEQERLENEKEEEIIQKEKEPIVLSDAFTIQIDESNALFGVDQEKKEAYIPREIWAQAKEQNDNWLETCLWQKDKKTSAKCCAKIKDGDEIWFMKPKGSAHLRWDKGDDPKKLAKRIQDVKKFLSSKADSPASPAEGQENSDPPTPPAAKQENGNEKKSQTDNLFSAMERISTAVQTPNEEEEKEINDLFSLWHAASYWGLLLKMEWMKDYSAIKDAISKMKTFSMHELKCNSPYVILYNFLTEKTDGDKQPKSEDEDQLVISLMSGEKLEPERYVEAVRRLTNYLEQYLHTLNITNEWESGSSNENQRVTLSGAAASRIQNKSSTSWRIRAFRAALAFACREDAISPSFPLNQKESEEEKQNDGVKWNPLKDWIAQAFCGCTWEQAAKDPKWDSQTVMKRQEELQQFFPKLEESIHRINFAPVNSAKENNTQLVLFTAVDKNKVQLISQSVIDWLNAPEDSMAWVTEENKKGQQEELARYIRRGYWRRLVRSMTSQYAKASKKTKASPNAQCTCEMDSDQSKLRPFLFALAAYLIEKKKIPQGKIAEKINLTISAPASPENTRLGDLAFCLEGSKKSFTFDDLAASFYNDNITKKLAGFVRQCSGFDASKRVKIVMGTQNFRGEKNSEKHTIKWNVTIG